MVEELRAVFAEHSHKVNERNFEKIVEFCSKVGSNNKYHPKEGSAKPMHGSDWWPTSVKLFIVFKSYFDENPVGMATYYEELFHYNSSYVHPNINNAGERLSLDEEDNHVFWNHLLLLDAFEKLLYFSQVLPKSIAQKMNDIEQQAWELLKGCNLFGDYTGE